MDALLARGRACGRLQPAMSATNPLARPPPLPLASDFGGFREALARFPLLANFFPDERLLPDPTQLPPPQPTGVASVAGSGSSGDGSDGGGGGACTGAAPAVSTATPAPETSGVALTVAVEDAEADGAPASAPAATPSAAPATAVPAVAARAAIAIAAAPAAVAPAAAAPVAAAPAAAAPATAAAAPAPAAPAPAAPAAKTSATAPALALAGRSPGTQRAGGTRAYAQGVLHVHVVCAEALRIRDALGHAKPAPSASVKCALCDDESPEEPLPVVHDGAASDSVHPPPTFRFRVASQRKLRAEALRFEIYSYEYGPRKDALGNGRLTLAQLEPGAVSSEVMPLRSAHGAMVHVKLYWQAAGAPPPPHPFLRAAEPPPIQSPLSAWQKAVWRLRTWYTQRAALERLCTEVGAFVAAGRRREEVGLRLRMLREGHSVVDLSRCNCQPVACRCADLGLFLPPRGRQPRPAAGGVGGGVGGGGGGGEPQSLGGGGGGASGAEVVRCPVTTLHLSNNGQLSSGGIDALVDRIGDACDLRALAELDLVNTGMVTGLPRALIDGVRGVPLSGLRKLNLSSDKIVCGHARIPRRRTADSPPERAQRALRFLRALSQDIADRRAGASSQPRSRHAHQPSGGLRRDDFLRMASKHADAVARRAESDLQPDLSDDRVYAPLLGELRTHLGGPEATAGGGGARAAQRKSAAARALLVQLLKDASGPQPNALVRLEPLDALTSLRELELQNNRLQSVPDMRGLPKLIYLNLGNNRLHFMARRDEWKHLCVPSLRELYLFENRLGDLQGRADAMGNEAVPFRPLFGHPCSAQCSRPGCVSCSAIHEDFPGALTELRVLRLFGNGIKTRKPPRHVPTSHAASHRAGLKALVDACPACLEEIDLRANELDSDERVSGADWPSSLMLVVDDENQKILAESTTESYFGETHRDYAGNFTLRTTPSTRRETLPVGFSRREPRSVTKPTPRPAAQQGTAQAPTPPTQPSSQPSQAPPPQAPPPQQPPRSHTPPASPMKPRNLLGTLTNALSVVPEESTQERNGTGWGTDPDLES